MIHQQPVLERLTIRQQIMKTLLFVLTTSLFLTATTAQAQTSTHFAINHIHIALLISLGLSVLGIFLSAYLLHRKTKVVKRKEQALDEYYTQLTEQSAERNDKIYQINNQLYEEIAKQEDTEALLLEARNYLDSIINSMPSILIGIDREGLITHWNHATQEKTQITHEQALGKHFQTLIDEPDISMSLITAAIDKKKPQKLEAIQEGHGSNAKFKDITIYPVTTIDIESAVIRIDDITNRVQLENMIIQNEKMGSLGELAAGVAHEINNPLGTILQSVQNIQRRLSDDLLTKIKVAEKQGVDLEKIVAYLDERKIFMFLENVKDAGERAANIVTNMLEFSRTHTHKHEPIQLIDLLNRSIDLSVISSSSPKKRVNAKMKITRHFPKECPAIYGMPAELQQVILNLVNNAYQAYNEHFLLHKDDPDNKPDGVLKIDASLVVNTYDVAIKIKDNGPGIDEWTQKHIFDPFFTTKETGKGTGLGLSVSYFIITEHHQGSISVESAVGEGTTFIIYLPIKK
jgi:two-component system NtrC family sensor kinase